MNNQREIYEALLAGEALINKESDYGMTISMSDDGGIFYADNDPCFVNRLHNPEFWQIYKEPKWYESIPNGGVFCWVSYFGMQVGCHEKNPKIITGYDGELFRTIDNGGFDIAEPLTKQEIQVFLSNVPEDL